MNRLLHQTCAGTPDLRRSFVGADSSASSCIPPVDPANALDSKTYGSDYGALLGRMQELGVKSFAHYSGTHGGLFGQNWEIESLVLLGPDRDMFERDQIFMEKASVAFGMTISVVDLGGWTLEQFREAISKNGVHALANCFGLVDPAVRREFNLPLVTLYDI